MIDMHLVNKSEIDAAAAHGGWICEGCGKPFELGDEAYRSPAGVGMPESLAPYLDGPASKEIIYGNYKCLDCHATGK